MMTRPGGRSNRSVAPADSAGVACGAADPRGPTRGSRGSRRIRRERCSEGASCCDADGCSRASVRAPQRRSRRALARRGRLGAPAARAGARGRAWAGQISRADALERTARLAGTQQPRRSCAGRRGGSGTISPTGRFPSRPETMSQHFRALRWCEDRAPQRHSFFRSRGSLWLTFRRSRRENETPGICSGLY